MIFAAAELENPVFPEALEELTRTLLAQLPSEPGVIDLQVDTSDFELIRRNRVRIVATWKAA